jgi:branched-chain amino acid transport system ATP-binding protein
LSFSVGKGIVKAVIGPNGAGKTTLFNIISGIYRANYGTVVFKEKNIEKMQPHQIALMGISRTFQNIRLFNHMTVLENVMVGLHGKTHSTLLDTALRLPRFKREESAILDRALEILNLTGLGSKANRLSTELSFGERRLVEIGRALASEPELLLLDEPTAGLNDEEKLNLLGVIEEMRSEDLTIILVEHDMKLVMKTADEILVLNFGEKIAEGTPHEIQHNDFVIKTYLGGVDYNTHAVD